MKDEARPAGTMRLFVAIDLPPAWKDALVELQERMRRALAGEEGANSEKIRWVRPDGIHLTLKFLGEVETARVEGIREALASAVPKAPALRLSLGGAGAFRDRSAPRVLLATIGGDTARLQELAERIDLGMHSAGFDRERGSFQPHLTLARLNQSAAPEIRELIGGLTGRVKPSQVEDFAVPEVHLIRSHLGREGARYEKIAMFPGGSGP